MRSKLLTVLVSSLLASGCGTESGPGYDAPGDVTPDGVDAAGDVPSDVPGDDAPPTWGVRLHGTVWGPGRMFPVSGALVAAFAARQDDISEMPYCEPCIDLPSGVPNTTSNPDGTFTLHVPEGMDYWIVVQKGQFRRMREYAAPTEVGDVDLPVDMTTLPSLKDQPAGDMTPNIALVYGDYDALQDVLGKAGIGAVDGSYNFVWGSEDGVFDVYDNSMPGSGSEHHGENLDNLILNLARMMEYHIIFFVCSYNANFDFMDNTTVQNNMRDYVRAGGKLYVSDYAYYVADMPWTEFLWFDEPLHGGCVENAFPGGCNGGPPFDAPSRSPEDDLSAWLIAVDDEVAEGAGGMAEFETLENWDNIGEIFESYVGDDIDGMPVRMFPRVWVEGIWNYDLEDVPSGWDYETYHPFTVSWPYGCGRVLFTTYHTVGDTSGGKHPGFLTQELILWYLIMELQVCQETVLI
ncbi:MAG: hypothetical protein JRG91_10430 [Deltaproteobacteria bacterium]|nr:hypothetical protein [Deltaproteobacteria bacterium]